MSLQPTFEAQKSQLISKLGLQATDFTQSYNCQTWSAGTSTGTADWLQESNPKFLTGVTFGTRAIGAAKEFTINVWMGPSYDVPSLLLTFGNASPDSCYVVADYIARGATPIGSDPQYTERYYSPALQAAWTSYYSKPGVMAIPPSPSYHLRLLTGPNRIALANLQTADAEEIINTHLSTFLSWLDSATPTVARSRGAFNLRDDKLRQFYFSAMTAIYSQEFGDEMGKTLAAVYTGPVAEAYVGGGS